jgi:hypothetical protein
MKKLAVPIVEYTLLIAEFSYQRIGLLMAGPNDEASRVHYSQVSSKEKLYQSEFIL